MIKKPKRGEHRSCSDCDKIRRNPPPPPPSPPPSSSSSSSSPLKEKPKIDIEKVLSPLTPLIVNGQKKERDDYNYYDEYTNEFFSALFRDFIDKPSDYINHISLKTAAEYYCIKPSTLSSKYQLWKNNNRGVIGTMDRRGRKRKLSDDDEEIIKQELFERMNNNNKTQNGHLVDFIMNLYPSFHPSMNYLTKFKKRNNISSRYTPIIHRTKKEKEITEEDKDNELDLLCHYYEVVENAINKYGSSRVYNYDEKPLSTAPKKVLSFQFKGRKTNKLVTDSNPDRVYSALCVVAANGDKLPITIIKKGIKGDSPSSLIVAEAVKPFGNHMGLTKSGWVNTASMVHWIRNIFAVNARRPCALIMDGYPCHWKEEVRDAAKELNIELISMPPNRTDEIQPLDVGVFGALQSMTDRDWETDDSIANYLHLFQQAWDDFSPVSIRKAFYSALALKEGVLEDDKNDQQLIIDEQNALNDIDNLLKIVMDAIPR